MYTHRHRDAQDTGTPPTQPPALSLHKSSCDRKPILVTLLPRLAHVSREVSEACFSLL